MTRARPGRVPAAPAAAGGGGATIGGGVSALATTAGFPLPLSTFCSASATDFRGGGTFVGAAEGMASGSVGAGRVAAGSARAAAGASFFGGGAFGNGREVFASPDRPVRRLTKRPSSMGGICTETSSPSGFGSFSSRSGRITAAASARTIAPMSLRRALRLSSSTARSASSAMRSAMPKSRLYVVAPLAELRRRFDAARAPHRRPSRSKHGS